MRGISVAAECGANAVEFVGGNGSADAAAANQQADLGVAVLNGVADFHRVVRIIVGDRAVVSAEVDQLVARFAQFFDGPLVERITRMIRTDCYSHDDSSFTDYPDYFCVICGWIS